VFIVAVLFISVSTQSGNFRIHPRIWWSVQVTKLLITQLSPTASHFLPVSSDSTAGEKILAFCGTTRFINIHEVRHWSLSQASWTHLCNGC